MQNLKFFSRPKINNPKELRQETLLIKFILVSILFGVGYFVMSFFNGFLMARYTMVVTIFLFVIGLFSYKFRVINLQNLSHAFIFLCWVIVVVLSLSSNGIHSFVLPWLSLIPVLGLVLVNSRVAWVWSGVGLITIGSFAFIEPKAFMPPHLFMMGNDLLTASLHIGLQFLILTLTYIFDNQQSELIYKIEQQNKDLAISQEEIATQNEELIQSQEEIASQRDMVAEQNINLIEARKIIEAQHQILLERNENLEEEIQKRTKELVDYNHQLEQFAFISSHNLRSPIARILGLGNLLELTVDTADESVIKKNLVHEARELDRVVKELSAILDVRKGTNKKVSEFNVKEGIELILSSLSLDISEAGAKIELSVQGNPMFRTVRPYFDSIVTNLVSNAIKYRNPKNTLLVQINWHYQGDFACLSIKDNGLGIDLNTYGQKVFSLYSRFHSHIDGKGLGLFMVKAQTESLGGKVEVNSLVDEGTTFCVYFKLS